MRGMRCLTTKGIEALRKSEIVCLGSFSTQGLGKKKMLKKIKERQLVGTWCPNIFDNADFHPTKGLNFRLIAVCRPKELDKRWERITADNLALDFGFGSVMPTIEMGYYLWEGRLLFMKLNDQRPDLSCLVVCHPEIYCGRDVCSRIMVIDNKMVVSGGISGLGHHFDDKTAYVYVIPV